MPVGIQAHRWAVALWIARPAKLNYATAAAVTDGYLDAGAEKLGAAFATFEAAYILASPSHLLWLCNGLTCWCAEGRPVLLHAAFCKGRQLWREAAL